MQCLRVFLATTAVLTLAACGGGSGGAFPSAPGAPRELAPSGTTVAYEKATLWVASELEITAVSTNDNGAATPLELLGPTPWTNTSTTVPAIVDVAIAPDGTKWQLENRDFGEGGYGWRLNAFAARENQPENTDGSDVETPMGLALGGDGVLVGTYAGNGLIKIDTYPYGASNASPIRTFKSATPALAFALGNDSLLYVARASGFDAYPPTSNGCCPLRSIATETPIYTYNGGFALGPDNSIYVVDIPGGFGGGIANHVVYVDVYPPGSGKAARRIGPLPTNYSALGRPPVIAVDAKNRVYVATNGEVYRFAGNANGAAKPERVMTVPEHGYVAALAIGPGIPRPGTRSLPVEERGPTI